MGCSATFCRDGAQRGRISRLAVLWRLSEGGNAIGCYSLGVDYANGLGVTRNLTHAIALYQKACDGNQFGGCFNLGLMYADGTGVTKDASRAAVLYRRACDGGYKQACSKAENPRGRSRPATPPHRWGNK